MWRWQLRSLRRAPTLWAKLSFFSFAIHLIFAAWFFGVEHNGVSLSFVLRAATRKSNAVAVLYVPPAPVVAKAAVAVAAKAPVKKNNAPTTVAPKKPEPKKQLQKVAAKQQEPKLKQDTEVAKKAEPPKKSEPPKAAPKKVETVQPKKVAAKQQEAKVADPAPSQEASTGSQALCMQLQQAVMSHWAPPPGVDEGCVCTVAFHVDWSGVIENVEVAEASGVLMYDIAAKCALAAAKLPSWTRGKNLTITFKQ